MRLVENSDINIQENDVDPYSIQKKKNRRPQSAKVDNSNLTPPISFSSEQIQDRKA